IIIFAGILSTLPASLIQFGQTAFVGQEDTSLAWLKVLGLLVSHCINRNAIITNGYCP
ncbi:hypothetical protein IDG59_14625, partial [Staphylococcus sp. EG-SA-1]|nr:hypothetical protein [Staphylococcus sp. EG-SA-1]